VIINETRVSNAIRNEKVKTPDWLAFYTISRAEAAKL